MKVTRIKTLRRGACGLPARVVSFRARCESWETCRPPPRRWASRALRSTSTGQTRHVVSRLRDIRLDYRTRAARTPPLRDFCSTPVRDSRQIRGNAVVISSRGDVAARFSLARQRVASRGTRLAVDDGNAFAKRRQSSEAESRGNGVRSNQGTGVRRAVVGDARPLQHLRTWHPMVKRSDTRGVPAVAHCDTRA